MNKKTGIIVLIILLCGILKVEDCFADNFSKIDSKIYENSEQGERIPVYIFYNNIELNAVEIEVKKQTGIDIDKLKNVVYLENIQNLNLFWQNQCNGEGLSDMYNNIQDIEKEVVNKYIVCKREETKKQYKEQAELIFGEKIINDEDVLFISTYSPMIIAKLTLEQIEMLEKVSYVDKIEYCSDVGDAQVDSSNYSAQSSNVYSLNEYKSMFGIDDIHSDTGLSGKDVKIGLLEASNFYDGYQTDGYNYDTLDELPSDRFKIVNSTKLYDQYSLHASEVARLLAGTEGIAYNSQIYGVAANSYSVSRLYSSVETLLDYNVDIINASISFESNKYTDEDKRIMEEWINYIVLTQNITFVKSAGNRGDSDGKITCPGNAENVITVGSFLCNGTSDTNDDVLESVSSYVETNGCEKPDLVAATGALDVQTSFAAPVVSGIVALMMEERSILKLYPELVKAIVMASCHYKVLPCEDGENQELLTAGITEKQGAGAFSPQIAISITQRGNYKFGYFLGEDDSYTANIIQPKYKASGLNVSLSWLRNAYFYLDNTDDINELISLDRRDLALGLLRDGTVLGVGTKEESSTEMVYLNNISNEQFDYRINVKYLTGSYYEEDEKIRYAYAWSIDDDKSFSLSDELEGIYFIKNLAKNQYITLNDSNFEMADFCGNINQMFVITNQTTNSDAMIIQSANCIGGLSNNNGMPVNTEFPSLVSLELSNNGAFSINMGSLCVTSIENDNSLQWINNEEISNYQYWHLEKCSYRVGDVNMDGELSEEDSDLIYQYVFSDGNLNNLQMFLADIDENNDINHTDYSESLLLY